MAVRGVSGCNCTRGGLEAGSGHPLSEPASNQVQPGQETSSELASAGFRASRFGTAINRSGRRSPNSSKRWMSRFEPPVRAVQSMDVPLMLSLPFDGCPVNGELVQSAGLQQVKLGYAEHQVTGRERASV